MVGRLSECARIEELLTEVRGGAGGARLVLGEPGIGKTALLRYGERQVMDMTAGQGAQPRCRQVSRPI